MRTEQGKVKYMFTVGPGNVIDAYKDWQRGDRTLSETSRTFSALSLANLALRLFSFRITTLRVELKKTTSS